MALQDDARPIPINDDGQRNGLSGKLSQPPGRNLIFANQVWDERHQAAISAAVANQMCSLSAKISSVFSR